MSSLDSSSAAGSSMDDYSDGHRNVQTLTKPHSFNTTTKTTANAKKGSHGGVFCADRFGDLETDQENFDEGDAEVWGSFTESFRQVQSVLDRNRVLIQQVNENHQSKIHDNLVKNVALIQEINGNISKVVSLYSDLSTNFSIMFHQRNTAVNATNDKGKGEGDNMQG